MITTRQLAILLHIRAGCNSFQDLSSVLGYKHNSTGSVYWHLTQLKQRRLVTWKDDKSRTLQLTGKGQRLLASYCLLPGGGVGEIEKIESKPDFDELVDYIFDKNDELFRRLAQSD